MTDTAPSENNLRDLLRSIRAPEADLPVFDPDAAPADPFALFAGWLASAINSGVSQPNAMTLSTASAEGTPSARTLLLKDVTPEGLWFASLSSSPKGVELEQNPRAALTLYWREQGRQVRVSGTVARAPRPVSERDFLARHPVARAQAIAGRESEPMPDREAVARLIASAKELLQVNPNFVPDSWNAYIVEPESIEFWQAAPRHEQLRLRYRQSGDAWVSERLWP